MDSGRQSRGTDAARVPRQAGARPEAGDHHRRGAGRPGGRGRARATRALVAACVAQRGAGAVRQRRRGAGSADGIAARDDELVAARGGGQAAPTRKALDQLAASSHLGYAAILSGDGSVVASSSGAPPASSGSSPRVPDTSGRRSRAARGSRTSSPLRPVAHRRSAGRSRSPRPPAGACSSRAFPPPRWPVPDVVPRSGIVRSSGLRRRLQAASDRIVEIGGPGEGRRASASWLRRPRTSRRARSAAIRGRRRHQRLRLAPRADPTHRRALSGHHGLAVMAALGHRRTGCDRRLRQPHPAPPLAGARCPARAAHAEVSALNASLEAKVADRTELAERRAHALGRSNAELEQFASVAAHDLQEPLRKIRMYCERLSAAATSSRRHAGGRRRAWRARPGACRT